jgi:hypothetical protein
VTTDRAALDAALARLLADAIVRELRAEMAADDSPARRADTPKRREADRAGNAGSLESTHAVEACNHDHSTTTTPQA